MTTKDAQDSGIPADTVTGGQRHAAAPTPGSRPRDPCAGDPCGPRRHRPPLGRGAGRAADRPRDRQRRLCGRPDPDRRQRCRPRRPDLAGGGVRRGRRPRPRRGVAAADLARLHRQGRGGGARRGRLPVSVRLRPAARERGLFRPGRCPDRDRLRRAAQNPAGVGLRQAPRRPAAQGPLRGARRRPDGAVPAHGRSAGRRPAARRGRARQPDRDQCGARHRRPGRDRPLWVLCARPRRDDPRRRPDPGRPVRARAPAGGGSDKRGRSAVERLAHRRAVRVPGAGGRGALARRLRGAAEAPRRDRRAGGLRRLPRPRHPGGIRGIRRRLSARSAGQARAGDHRGTARSPDLAPQRARRHAGGLLVLSRPLSARAACLGCPPAPLGARRRRRAAAGLPRARL